MAAQLKKLRNKIFICLVIFFSIGLSSRSFAQTCPLTTDAITSGCDSTSVNLFDGILSDTSGLVVTFYSDNLYSSSIWAAGVGFGIDP